MKLGRSVIVYLGYFFGAVVLLVVVLVGLLFMSPTSSFFGVTSITAREVYTTYCAKQIPGINDVLMHRNIIIESNFIDVEVRVRKLGQQDAGSIQVWENTSGLAFNNVKRTHIEWSQVMLPRTHKDADGNVVSTTGELWYKIKIIEPRGIVSRSSSSFVYINMYATEDNSPNQEPFNFILDTGHSNVRFAADNDSIVERNALEVGNLEIINARGEIYLPPAPEDLEQDSFYVNVGNVYVDTRSVILNCHSPVLGNVHIQTGSGGTFNFRDVGGNFHVEGGINTVNFGNVGGDVSAHGTIVHINQRGGSVITGDVNYHATSGSVVINQCRILTAQTVHANVVVLGELAGLDFEGTNSASIEVASIKGDTARAKTVHGEIRLFRVWVDTHVESETGTIRVDFDPGIEIGVDHEPTLFVRAYDGSVTARYIVGTVDIFVRALGNSNVFAEFRQVKGATNRIVYEGSTNPNRNKGEITVTFCKDISYCILNLEARSASAHNQTSPSLLSNSGSPSTLLYTGASLVNGAWYHVNWANRVGESMGNLTVSTSNKFVLRSS
jgi:hypothetical protein